MNEMNAYDAPSAPRKAWVTPAVITATVVKNSEGVNFQPFSEFPNSSTGSS